MISETPFQIQLRQLFQRDSRFSDPDQKMFFDLLVEQATSAMTKPTIPKVAYLSGNVTDIHQAPKDNPWNNSLIDSMQIDSLSILNPRNTLLSVIPDRAKNDGSVLKIVESYLVATKLYLDSDPHASTVLVVPLLRLLSLHEAEMENLGRSVLITGSNQSGEVGVLAFNRGTSPLSHLEMIRTRLTD